MKGIIALDIDGTVTAHTHHLDRDVANFLVQLSADGWTFIFITGRSFAWGHAVLKELPFSYHFAVHNGVIILEMPSKRVLLKRQLTRDILPVMDALCEGEESNYVVYSGCGHDDYSYLCPQKFSPQLRDYVLKRYEQSHEPWRPLTSFAELPIADFAAVKCFGKQEAAVRLAQKIEQQLNLHVPMIKDPLDSSYYVLQGTHVEATKGNTLDSFKSLLSSDAVVIAAGDDNNDLSMLAAADIKIAMATAPDALKNCADIIAPSAEENGIIVGLKKALKMV